MAEPESSVQVRWRVLAAAVLISGTVSVAALSWWRGRGEDLPMTSPLWAAFLVIVTALVLVLGLRVRGWVRKGEVIDGVGATRTLVFGQTAALAGAVIAGYPAALLALALNDLNGPAPRAVALVAAVVLLAAVLMSVAGMVTQWCCQVPPQDDDRDGPSRPLG